MKRILMIGALLSTLVTQAQEKIPREEALKYSFIASANLKEMLNTPIPTDPDVKRPVAVKDGEYGGMVLPESKLSAETIAKAGKDVSAIGQLWMVKLSPMNGGEAVPASKLKMVHVSSGDQEADVVCCALGVRKDTDGKLELLIYGKDREPLVRVPVKSVSGQQDTPIDLLAERRDEGGQITLKILGKYEASFMVTDPER